MGVQAIALQKRYPEPKTTGIDKKSHIPCKFFSQGACWKGTDCPLSHDPKDAAPRPLMLKKAEMCRFFAEGGGCIRGAACTYAHGQAELEAIEKYVGLMQEENDKRGAMAASRMPFFNKVKRPGDWIC